MIQTCPVRAAVDNSKVKNPVLTLTLSNGQTLVGPAYLAPGDHVVCLAQLDDAPSIYVRCAHVSSVS